uniref:Uncharacterized protein n=1 Tax=Rhizophora mucronata TaxID=61149 RepID=A0A2P2QN93_RHIMU
MHAFLTRALIGDLFLPSCVASYAYCA